MLSTRKRKQPSALIPQNSRKAQTRRCFLLRHVNWQITLLGHKAQNISLYRQSGNLLLPTIYVYVGHTMIGSEYKHQQCCGTNIVFRNIWIFGKVLATFTVRIQSWRGEPSVFAHSEQKKYRFLALWTMMRIANRNKTYYVVRAMPLENFRYLCMTDQVWKTTPSKYCWLRSTI